LDIWKGFQYAVTEKLKENYENIINDVEVWGEKRAGYYPTNTDAWTEDTITTWVYYVPTQAKQMMTENMSNAIVGRKCGLATAAFNIGQNFYCGRYIASDNNPVNLEHIDTIYWKSKWNIVPPSLKIYLMFIDVSGETLTSSDLASIYISDNTWYDFSQTSNDINSWTDSGSFDITKVKSLYFHADDGGTGIDRNFYLDEFYMTMKANRSDNVDSNSGYDSASANTYGHRTSAPINHNGFKTATQCNALASKIVQYTKNPMYSCTVKLDGFHDMQLNENFELIHHDNLILPIDAITWKFDKNQISTTLNLGTPLLTTDEILKKIYIDVDEVKTDYGISYYIG